MAIWVTRPDERGTELVDILAQAGIFAIHLPLLNIEAGRELNLLPNQINALAPQDYVFVVSKNAVDYAVTTLKAIGFRWRSDLQYFAVGQRTAQYFACQSEQAVCYPIEQENSEGLLNLPAMQHLTDKRILILRGNGGREFFAEQATQRGANIQVIECYQRLLTSQNNHEQTSLLIRSGVEKIVVTSLDILNALLEFIPGNEHEWLKNCQLITVSQRIADAAKTLGWQHILISTRADNHSLCETVLTSKTS